jgi:hypothetical protein
LEREDRELLGRYWRTGGKKPKGIRKSGVDVKMAQEDRQDVEYEIERQREGKKRKAERGRERVAREKLERRERER